MSFDAVSFIQGFEQNGGWHDESLLRFDSTAERGWGVFARTDIPVWQSQNDADLDDIVDITPGWDHTLPHPISLHTFILHITVIFPFTRVGMV